MHYADSEGPRCPPRVAYCFPAEPGSSPRCQTAARLQPSPNPPQAYPLPSPLPSSETQRKGRQAIPANLPGRWEAETRRPFYLPPAPFFITLPLPTTVPPLPALPMRETAGSCGKLRKTAESCGLRCAGAQRSCRADFQQRGSASALPAEQTPRSRTHFFPQGGPGFCSAFTIRCLWLWGALPLRDTSGSRTEPAGSSAPAPRRCADRGEAPIAFSDLRSKNHCLYHNISSPLLFIFILFIPPVTVCGK